MVAGLVIDTTAPTFLSILAPLNTTPYIAGNDLDFDVSFNGPITVTGTPLTYMSLSLVANLAMLPMSPNQVMTWLGFVIKWAALVLMFIIVGGISLDNNSKIDQNSGSITDTAENSYDFDTALTPASWSHIKVGTPVVELSALASDYITSANKASFPLTGNCSDYGGQVSVTLTKGSQSASATTSCTSGSWSVNADTRCHY